MLNRTWYFNEKQVIGTDGAVLNWDDHRFFTLTYKGKKFYGELLQDDTESNFLSLKINHRVFSVRKKGLLDELIVSLGLDNVKPRKLKELLAPMPGRVTHISVRVGQVLEPGDELLSLEAMKMENVLKAEGSGTVKVIHAVVNQVVEKGSMLIEFE
jgi:biotin carboxyl carrier protein